MKKRNSNFTVHYFFVVVNFSFVSDSLFIDFNSLFLLVSPGAWSLKSIWHNTKVYNVLIEMKNIGQCLWSKSGYCPFFLCLFKLIKEQRNKLFIHIIFIIHLFFFCIWITYCWSVSSLFRQKNDFFFIHFYICKDVLMWWISLFVSIQFYFFVALWEKMHVKRNEDRGKTKWKM